MSLLTIEDQDFLLSSSDISVFADAFGARANSLSLIPSTATPADRQAIALSEFRLLDPEAQRRLMIALGVLRSPAKVGDLHHTIADESVSRAVLAWSASLPDFIVAVAGTTDPRRISLWSADSMSASVRKILAAESPLTDDEIGLKVSTQAAVVFVAAVDQLRAARLYSELNHSAPELLFSSAEIVARLKDSVSEDFRWPLTFVEKLLPRGLLGSLTASEIDAAMSELVTAGLIENVAAGRFEMSSLGRIVCDGIVHDVSKVALGVTAVADDGQLGRDVVLLIRSSFNLFMIAMAGQQGIIAAVNNDELDAVLHLSLQPARPATIVATAKDEPTVMPVPKAAAKPAPLWHFAEAGQTMGPVDEGVLRARLARGELPGDTLVWNPALSGWITAASAGLLTPPAVSPPLVPPLASRVCPRCALPLEPGLRFCTGCGAPLA